MYNFVHVLDMVREFGVHVALADSTKFAVCNVGI